MDTDFWLQRWHDGQTGFHQDEVMPLLQKHWPALQLPHAARVLVPLCGKTLDMHWLAAQGHRVLGVELSPLAVTQFFAEAGLQPQRHTSSAGEHFIAGPIEIICGDAFALDRSVLADCMAVYDRAALVALPAELRRQYLHTTLRTPAGRLRWAADHPGLSAGRKSRPTLRGGCRRSTCAVRWAVAGAAAGTARHPRAGATFSR
ncbi:putative Thiopurine S-methyltransferase [Xanthomonas phaseoli pv. phaseoli]|uniref:Thiopurine S-methyltransferase n=1 Tax=Xanthomonas campestris pv. phaseoli TaxID=317013 RepID=A0AB38DZ09_XANCH|nr:putative Thiopurine S-methyltransferase [Xanthomonas phaseoli pv. phaseoli]SON82775.1 putative Thiopurine S-methyltransferase [Xanthomonas phaseoli pv. phaseoli]SON87041.1 putative Thiopurine S-methyltransferase [Xanthomonas phaseoli pv. phaseoli]SOO27061.1 putative Thiopurine S-methyltransferase [Xanthomonas phaseoli pv. phaseoli]